MVRLIVFFSFNLIFSHPSRSGRNSDFVTKIEIYIKECTSRNVRIQAVCDFSDFHKDFRSLQQQLPTRPPRGYPGGLITNPTPQGGTPWGFNYQPDPPGGYPPPITNPHNFQPPTEKEREGTSLTFSNQFGWEGGRGSAGGVSPVIIILQS